MELYKIFAIINRAIKGLHCSIFPTTMAGCDEQNSKCQSQGSSHAGKQLTMDGNFSHCNQMSQEMFYDDGSPHDDNDTDDECITSSKDENE